MCTKFYKYLKICFIFKMDSACLWFPENRIVCQYDSVLGRVGGRRPDQQFVSERPALYVFYEVRVLSIQLWCPCLHAPIMPCRQGIIHRLSAIEETPSKHLNTVSSILNIESISKFCKIILTLHNQTNIFIQMTINMNNRDQGKIWYLW